MRVRVGYRTAVQHCLFLMVMSLVFKPSHVYMCSKPLNPKYNIGPTRPGTTQVWKRKRTEGPHESSESLPHGQLMIRVRFWGL